MAVALCIALSRHWIRLLKWLLFIINNRLCGQPDLTPACRPSWSQLGENTGFYGLTRLTDVAGGLFLGVRSVCRRNPRHPRTACWRWHRVRYLLLHLQHRSRCTYVNRLSTLHLSREISRPSWCSPNTSTSLSGSLSTVRDLTFLLCRIWLCILTVSDFYNNLNGFYGTIVECCTSKACPTMSAGARCAPQSSIQSLLTRNTF